MRCEQSRYFRRHFRLIADVCRAIQQRSGDRLSSRAEVGGAMSRAARGYVLKLTFAPRECACRGGSATRPRHGFRKLTLAEKALLNELADFYNDQERRAWPAIATIAKHLGISSRRAQQIVTQLCCKGVLTRRKRLRTNGSQKSNDYF